MNFSLHSRTDRTFYRPLYETPTLIGPVMFGIKKNGYAVQTTSKLIKEPKDSTSSEDKFFRPENVELIKKHSKEVAKFVAITAVGAYAAIKTIDTVSKVILKKTKSADNEEL